MTQKRLSIFVIPSLLVAISCGGGSGRTVDVTDPDAPPVLSDRQPPIASQNPASVSRPPDNSQPPSGPTGTPSKPPPGGGSCVSLCMSLPELGCQTPDQGCRQGCDELMAQPCGAQIFALEACAIGVACPEELANADAALQQEVAAKCPNQFQAFVSCIQLSD